jgi:large subunit ribosomal protein L16
LLIPEKTKFKKNQKRKVRGFEKKNSTSSCLCYGNIGLQALETGLITPQQIESVRRVMVRYNRKSSKGWIRIFPNWIITRKTKGLRMGRGKGAFKNYVFRVRAGRLLFEFQSRFMLKVSLSLRIAASKLPIKTRIIYKR